MYEPKARLRRLARAAYQFYKQSYPRESARLGARNGGSPYTAGMKNALARANRARLGYGH